MSGPLFSVVMPTHNRPELLLEAIHSLGRQRIDAFEIIVVDDASTPPVDAQALSAAGQRPVRVLRHDQPRGGAASKSAGIAQARGHWVAFLDDDDLLADDHLETLAAVLTPRDDVEVCFIDVGWFGCDSAQASDRSHRDATWAVIDRTVHRREGQDLVLIGEGLTEALIRSTPMQFQRPVVRRDAFERIGVFRAECLLWDCDWAIRASMVARCAFLARPVYLQREGQGYFTRPGRQLLTGESAREILHHLRCSPPRALTAPESARLRQLEAQKTFDLAYLQAQHGQRGAALRSWWRSQRLSLHLGRLKFPLRLLVSRPGA